MYLCSLSVKGTRGAQNGAKSQVGKILKFYTTVLGMLIIPCGFRGGVRISTLFFFFLLHRDVSFNIYALLIIFLRVN